MTRAQALAKVHKLMRLSASSNAHEAAAALRQAQALMQSHAIDASELDADGFEAIGEAEQPNRGDTMPIYAVGLAAAVARAFGLEYLQKPVCWFPKKRSKLVLVGPRSRVEVGIYAYAVLLRQLERDRRKHLARTRVAKNRAARGDVFGSGWVSAVRSTLEAFASTDEDRTRLLAYMARHYPDLQTTTAKPRASKTVSWRDHQNGREAGRKAQLHRGVGGASASPAQLEHTS